MAAAPAVLGRLPRPPRSPGSTSTSSTHNHNLCRHEINRAAPRGVCGVFPRSPEELATATAGGGVATAAALPAAAMVVPR